MALLARCSDCGQRWWGVDARIGPDGHVCPEPEDVPLRSALDDEWTWLCPLGCGTSFDLALHHPGFREAIGLIHWCGAPSNGDGPAGQPAGADRR